MTCRYANDLLLTDVARRITNETRELNNLLTNGHLPDAKAKSKAMKKDIKGLITLLDDLMEQRR